MHDYCSKYNDKHLIKKAQGGVDQLVRNGKVRHRVPTRSWVRILGKSSPPIGESRLRLRISQFPEGGRTPKTLSKKKHLIKKIHTQTHILSLEIFTLLFELKHIQPSLYLSHLLSFLFEHRLYFNYALQVFKRVSMIQMNLW